MLKKVRTDFQLRATMINRIVILLLFIVIPIQANAQNYTDFQSRFVGSVDYRFNDKWKIIGEYRYTLQKDFQEFRNSSGQLEAHYNITKRVKLLGAYRFITNHREDNHRFFGGVQADIKIRDLTISSKTRYQYSTQHFDSYFMAYYEPAKQFIREKVTFDYNIPNSKASFFTGTEVFIKIDDKTKDFRFHRARYIVGGEYKFKYGNTLGVTFFYDDRDNPRKTDRYVLVTKYSLSINDLIKKVKKDKKKKLKALEKAKTEQASN